VLVGFRVLGVRVHAVQIPKVVMLLENWIAKPAGSRYVAVTGMHGVMEAQRDVIFSRSLTQQIAWFPMACRSSGSDAGRSSR
jgi:hypothetical protein